MNTSSICSVLCYHNKFKCETKLFKAVKFAVVMQILHPETGL